MSKIIALILFSLTLAACSPEQLFSMIARSEVEQAASEQVNNSQSLIEELEASISAKLATSQQSAKLSSNSSDGSYGYAFRNLSTNTSNFSFEVIAVLPPLEQSEWFYEGWLINPKTKERKSVGPLFLNNDNSRTLSYSSKTALTDFTRIEITAQTSAEKTPGQVILAGDFEAEQ